MTPIRVGLIGCGGIADEHIRGYHAHGRDIAVAAVADVDTWPATCAESASASRSDVRRRPIP